MWKLKLASSDHVFLSGAGGMHLDIRGNGLQPSHEMSNLGNAPLEEDQEGLDEPVHQNQWSKYWLATGILTLDCRLV